MSAAQRLRIVCPSRHLAGTIRHTPRVEPESVVKGARVRTWVIGMNEFAYDDERLLRTVENEPD
jgi:hypothetical protein